MSFQVDYKKIGKINWYRQGGACRLFYVYTPYLSINQTIGYDREILYQKGEVNAGFFDRELEGKKFCAVLGRQTKDNKFIDKLILEWQKSNDSARIFAANKNGWRDCY